MSVTMTHMDKWHWRLRYWIASKLFRASEMVNPRCFRSEDLHRALDSDVEPLFAPDVCELREPTVH